VGAWGFKVGAVFDRVGKILRWCRDSKILGATAAGAGELLPEDALTEGGVSGGGRPPWIYASPISSLGLAASGLLQVTTSNCFHMCEIQLNLYTNN
jgi:hypothetical protein